MAQMAFDFDALCVESPLPQPPVSIQPIRQILKEVLPPPPAPVWAPLVLSSVPKHNAHNPKFQVDASMLADRSSQEAKYAANLEAIRLLAKLKDESRQATEDEQRILARYAGWGAVPHAFMQEPDHPWFHQARDLKRSMDEDAWKAARESTVNAHYTPLELIDKIWETVMRLGFTGGRIIEPSCGAGHFIGRMPAPLRATSQITAIEVDATTAQIARQLYPECDIRHQGFEKFSAPRARYDLAIGNVPFGDYSLFDPEYDQFKLSVHNYFIMKSVNLVRPGGLVAFITSTFTLDASAYQSKLRAWLKNKVRLIGAFRLPQGIFSESANCDVSADVLIMQVLDAGESAPCHYENVVQASQLDDRIFPKSSYGFQINEYFATHRNALLGELKREKNQFGKDAVGVVGKDGWPVRWDAATSHLEACYLPEKKAPPEKARLERLVVHADRLMDGDIHRAENGKLCVIEDGEPVAVPAKDSVRIGAMLDLARQVRKLLAAQSVADFPEADLAGMREWLNSLYDSFVARHGYLSKPANIRSVRRWRDLPLLLSLELWDDEKETALKAPIFTERTTGGSVKRHSADTLADAVAICYGECLAVDLERIAGLLSKAEDEIEVALEAEGLAYFEPGEGRWMLREEFLAGNVRQRLADARVAAAKDERFAVHVGLLEEVLPPDLGPGDIMVQLGTPWIPADVIEAFTREICDTTYGGVTYTEAIAEWEVSCYASQAARVRWGSKDHMPQQLIELALNLREPTVKDKLPDGKEVVNIVATAASREKQEVIKAEFKRWVWTDKARADRLVRIYNDRFNSFVPRKFDGEFLTFPDKSTSVTFRPNQKSAIARYLQSGNTGVFHKTGAGKTMILCAIAHEARRLGLVRKTVITVQNSTLYQFAAEYLRIYPNANILVPDRDELSGLKRKAMLSKIAMGDWEAVIVAHSSLEKLPMGESAMKEAEDILMAPIHEQLDLATDARAIKRLVSVGNRFEAQTKKLFSKRNADEHLQFEDLGFGQLLVDEAHLFKNLLFYTKMERVAGLQQAASKRAMDLFMKSLWLRKQHGRRFGLVLATATPITNTIAEIYTMQRYLQPDVLEAAGLSHFDAWAAMFGEVVSAVEPTPTGRGFRINKRFARFHNVPELMRLYLQSADIRQKQHMAGILKEPAIAGGSPVVVVSKLHERQSEYIDQLVERVEAIKAREVTPDQDNMLKVVHEGRLIALDLGCIYGTRQENPESKAVKCAANVVRHYKESADIKGTQLIFCDLSVPQKDGTWSTYQEVMDLLIESGIPREVIAFAQDYDTDAQRLKLFNRVRAGLVRVVLGSTARLGTGANVQDRIVAMHHLDVPWRPTDLEQRDGRGIRDGNMNEEVWIYRYVTEASFDLYMWNTCEHKARFILQVMDPDMKVRSVEDIAVATLSYAEVKAAASGDPKVIEKITLDAELAKLELSWSAFQSEMSGHSYRMASMKRELEVTSARIPVLENYLAQWEADPPQTLSIEGQTLGIGPAATAISAWLKLNLRPANKRVTHTIGTFGAGKLSAWLNAPDYELSLVFDDDISVGLGAGKTPADIESALKHFTQNLVIKLRDYRKRNAEARKALDELAQVSKSVWPHQARHDEVIARLEVLDHELGLTEGENTVGLETAEDAKEPEAVEELADA